MHVMKELKQQHESTKAAFDNKKYSINQSNFYFRLKIQIVQNITIE